MENEHYRTLIENLNEVVYILNDRAEITYITANIEAIGGYSVAEVMGRKFTDFVHPGDLPGRVDNAEKALALLKKKTRSDSLNILRMVPPTNIIATDDNPIPFGLAAYGDSSHTERHNP